MTELKVIDLTGKEEAQTSGEGFLSQIIRRVVKGERIVGEVVEEKIENLIMYTAEIRDGLFVNNVEDKFNTVEQAVDAIKQWHQEEEDFLRQSTASPETYRSVMSELNVSSRDFMNNSNLRIEILKIHDKTKEISVLNQLIKDAEGEIKFFDSEENGGASAHLVKVHKVEIVNNKSAIKRLEADIEVSKSRISNLINR